MSGGNLDLHVQPETSGMPGTVIDPDVNIDDDSVVTRTTTQMIEISQALNLKELKILDHWWKCKYFDGLYFMTSMTVPYQIIMIMVLNIAQLNEN